MDKVKPNTKIPADYPSLDLKVLEAYTRDVGRGVIRMDYNSMDKIAISTGSIVSVKGKRDTVAKVVPLYPSDEDKGIVRLDGLIRNNAGSEIGTLVKIKPIMAGDSAFAEKVTVVPLEQIPPIDERYMADALESMPVVKGDNLMIPYFGGRLTFQVLSTIPPNKPVIVTVKTSFIIVEQSKELAPYKIAFDDYLENVKSQFKQKLQDELKNEKLDFPKITKLITDYQIEKNNITNVMKGLTELLDED